ncbi:hypothetical protein CsSME_00030344 [Camellia sinensis var. sinensis]
MADTPVNLNHTAKAAVTGGGNYHNLLGLGPPSDYEKQGLESLMPELKTSIDKGIKFANQ